MKSLKFFDYCGGIFSCSFLALGLPSLPSVGFAHKGALFALVWLMLGCLVSAAFLKNVIKLRHLDSHKERLLERK